MLEDLYRCLFWPRNVLFGIPSRLELGVPVHLLDPNYSEIDSISRANSFLDS